MKAEFSWRENSGSLDIKVPPGDEVVASFVAGDLPNDPQSVRRAADWFRDRAENGMRPNEAGLGQDGYVATVEGDTVTLESNYGQFPTARYPLSDMIEILDDLAAWLDEHHEERPRPTRKSPPRPWVSSSSEPSGEA